MSRVWTLQVNGCTHSTDVDAEKPLLLVLREDLGLTGSKIGCGEGECGVCTVLVGGVPVRSCITPVGEVMGKTIVTIEGLEAGGRLHPVQQAFVECGAMQCGYCTPGMIMSAVGLLRCHPHPSRDTIIEHMQGNLCRCGCYPRIVVAVQRAAAEVRTDERFGGVR